MKLFRTLLLTAVVIAASCLQGFAHDPTKETNEQLKSRIVKLIDQPDLSKLDGQKFHTEVEFMITPHNEVLVLAVYTDQLFLDRYVKDQLNYQPVRLKGVYKLKPYRLTVTFVQP